MTKIVLGGFALILNAETNSRVVESQLMDNLNVEVDMELSDSCTIVRCRLSDVFFRISYLNYVSFLHIVRDNLGRKSDREQWDILENVWGQEPSESNVTEHDVQSLTQSKEVLYSSSARVIRYGQGRRTSANHSITITFGCADVAFVFVRDDSLDIRNSSYATIGIRGQGFDCEIGRRDDGVNWLNFSLHNLFAVDLGRNGRLCRSSHRVNIDINKVESPNVLVEGYSARRLEDNTNVDSQLVVKVERDSSNTGDVNVVVIISFLSVTAMVQPIEDLINFFTCKWDTAALAKLGISNGVLSIKTSNIAEPANTEDFSIASFKSKISLRFVSHYARFIFAANELDSHSRALILSG
jgi:hypothetical protein